MVSSSVWTSNIQPRLLATPDRVLRKNYPPQPIDCSTQKARFLSSKNGWSKPMPRAIGSAGDWILGESDARRGVAARRSRVALSVAMLQRYRGALPPLRAPAVLCPQINRGY